MELLEALHVLARCYVEAKADGAVNWFDVPKFRPVLLAMGVAFDGLEKVEAEVKDLDMAELLALAAKLQAIAATVGGR
jgi:hypothetical protein